MVDEINNNCLNSKKNVSYLLDWDEDKVLKTIKAKENMIIILPISWCLFIINFDTLFPLQYPVNIKCFIIQMNNTFSCCSWDRTWPFCSYCCYFLVSLQPPRLQINHKKITRSNTTTTTTKINLNNKKNIIIKCLMTLNIIIRCKHYVKNSHFVVLTQQTFKNINFFPFASIFFV